MSILLALGILWVFAALTMTAGWVWQRRRANAGIVDVLWAVCLGAGAMLMAILGTGSAATRVLLGLMGGLWGLRLAAHLWRRVRGGPEDGRYQHLRAHWGGNQLRFFFFFQFQAVLVVLFALPFWAAANNPKAPIGWLAVSAAIWTLGVAGESIADRQLAEFRSRQGHGHRTCREGLWRYSRHPNYFFEWLHWFAYVALAQGGPHAWLSATGPVLMFVFLRWLSGIPFTEAQALRTRGADYQDYQRRTPLLFPWFPKESA